MSKIDFLLDDIRKSCELGEIENVISLCDELKQETKLNIEPCPDCVYYTVKEEKKYKVEECKKHKKPSN